MSRYSEFIIRESAGAVYLKYINLSPHNVRFGLLDGDLLKAVTDAGALSTALLTFTFPAASILNSVGC